ncbi:MAG: phenylalanine--tRNA ligase subunit beta [Candidatus Daviesbacteria bacterium]|nr:phenylalanine--tRNA ligase subunit beta [Candidatus Daviesbacteria bacterium]
MRVSLSWLKELVDLKVSPQELSQVISKRIQGGVKELTDTYLELDLKGYNRADLLSLRGVADEVAAITSSEVKFIEVDPKFESRGGLRVDMESNLCSFYCLAKIQGLKVRESSPEWKKKLAESGMRSVNNITDITNLIMVEYGQPLHAFDASKVRDEHIVIRTAKPGEKLTTLDSVERILSHEDLVISDAKKLLGLAGVMGGKDSAVSDNTESILLEAAIFTGKVLRGTSRRHNLYSEASKRFQHGLTKTRLLQALFAAVEEYKKLGGQVTGITIRGDIVDKGIQIDLNMNRVESLIGIQISQEQVKNYLEKLHFKVNNKSHSSNLSTLVVEPPYFRLDIEREEDLIEEIARMFGYENIPSKKLDNNLPTKVDQTMFDLNNNLKKTLKDLGLTEIQTYSFISSKAMEVLGFNEKLKNTLVKIGNPISSETEYLRRDLWPNLLEKMVENLKSSSDIAIFELGKVYSKIGETHQEEYRLAIALTNTTTNPLSELNQIALDLFKKLNLGLKIEPGKNNLGLFHPNRFLKIMKKGKEIGEVAEIHLRVLDKFGSDAKAAIFEMSLEPFY